MNERPETSAAVLDEFLGARPRVAWRNRAQWIAVGLSAMLLILLFARFVSGGSAANYLSVPLVRDDLPASISGMGRLQAIGARDVSSELAGTITEILVNDRDRVEQGQILARIDPLPFQDAVAASQALIEAREASLANAEARVARLQARLASFEGVRRRSGGLVPSDREMVAARSELDRANDELRAAQLEIGPGREALAAARLRLAATEIRSPVAGVILQRHVRLGDRLEGPTRARRLFTIAGDLSRLKLDIVANDGLGSKLTAGQAVRLTVEGFPGRTFAAVVRQALIVPAQPIARSPADSSNSGAGPDAGSYRISLDIQNPDLRLRPGATVNARIELGLRRDVMLVPNAALRFARVSGLEREPGQVKQMDSVLVLENDGTPRRVPVTLGGDDGNRTEITSDALHAGDRVIVGLR